MTHRSWFPFILIGLSLALAVIIAAVYKQNPAPVAEDDAVVLIAPTAEQYEAGVRAVLAGLADTSDVGVAYDALVAMRVPSVDYQASHLELVLALAQLKSGNIEEGQARLDIARANYSWLTP